MKNQLNEFSLELPAESVNESFARYAVSSFIAALDPTLEEIADIRTVVSEAVTNCVVHAYREKKGKIYINVKYFDDRTVKIRIKDKGCGIPDIEKAMQPFWSGDTSGERGGMGFTIMTNFTDCMKIRSTLGKGTVVTLEKKLKKLSRR